MKLEKGLIDLLIHIENDELVPYYGSVESWDVISQWLLIIIVYKVPSFIWAFSSDHPIGEDPWSSSKGIEIKRRRNGWTNRGSHRHFEESINSGWVDGIKVSSYLIEVLIEVLAFCDSYWWVYIEVPVSIDKYFIDFLLLCRSHVLVSIYWVLVY